MKKLLATEKCHQPPAFFPAEGRHGELTVAVSSLSLGGAERLVLDWANRIRSRWRVHLIVLRSRDHDKEWYVPPHIRVTRVEDLFVKVSGRAHNLEEQRLRVLREIGALIAHSAIPVCVCHLLRRDERDALSAHGAIIVQVLHNAKDGWHESASLLDPSANTIAVSDACAHDLRKLGFEGPVSVIRHIPQQRIQDESAREEFRAQWNIPEDACVIGMIGAVKRQKNYVRALHILREILKTRDVYLAILGGPVNVREEGRREWFATIAEIERLGLRNRVAMPGFVPLAAQCLPAFDLMLNTSDYEGLSIATLEALQAGLPVVASQVGGQGELSAPGLQLIDPNASEAVWAEAILRRIGTKYDSPEWSRFPSYRLWTLASLARNVKPSGKTLFVTSNLNAGGAQRSLVNLATHIADSADFEVMVAGDSTSDYFHRQLKKAGVQVQRTTETQDAFAHAEALVSKICSEGFGTVCFWNVDRRVKLLLVKSLAATSVRFVDVSPGGYAFEEIDEVQNFQRMIAFSKEDYYRRLDKLVLKYDGDYPTECEGKVVVIRNGVPKPEKTKRTYQARGSRVVVSGRIAPSKFLIEIIEAMRMVRREIPDAELHIYGTAEESENEYLDEVMKAAKSVDAIFHGSDFEVTESLPRYDAFVVLGKHQGCPNALLEALSVGLPVIANDDGGTREQVRDSITGLLVPSTDPIDLSPAIIKRLRNQRLAARLGTTGRVFVEGHFSMDEMAKHYLELLQCGAKESREERELAFA